MTDAPVQERRLRVCYGKVGRLRFLGHLEVVRALERAVRRAALPVAYSRGFNPRPRMAFGPALPVGVAGLREYVDVWLARRAGAAAASAALAAALPAELPIRQARFVPPGAPSLAADVAAAHYLVGYVGLGEEAVPGLEEGLARLRRRETLDVERRGRSRTYLLSHALLRQPRVVTRAVAGPGEGGADAALADGFAQVGASVGLEEWLRFKDQAPIPPEAVAEAVAEGVGEEVSAVGAPPLNLRVCRMECYTQRDGNLVRLWEV